MLGCPTIETDEDGFDGLSEEVDCSNAEGGPDCEEEYYGFGEEHVEGSSDGGLESVPDVVFFGCFGEFFAGVGFSVGGGTDVEGSLAEDYGAAGFAEDDDVKGEESTLR